LEEEVEKAYEIFKDKRKKYKENFSFEHKYNNTSIFGTKEELTNAMSDFIVIFVDKTMKDLDEKTKKIIKKGGKVLKDAVNEMDKLPYGKIKLVEGTELNCNHVILASNPFYNTKGKLN
jgi:predicted enzyme related to lactoylglutathione lyase